MPTFFQSMLSAAKLANRKSLVDFAVKKMSGLKVTSVVNSQSLDKFFNYLEKTDPNRLATIEKLVDKAFTNNGLASPKALRNTIHTVGKISNVISGINSVKNTLSELANNPIGTILSTHETFGILRSAVVPIKDGRVVGLHSRLTLKISLLLDHVNVRRGRTVDLNAYFKNPIVRNSTLRKGSYIEVEHPYLRRDQVTNSKLLYMSGLLFRRLAQKRSLFNSETYRTVDNTLNKNLERVVHDRWLGHIKNIRNEFKRRVRNLNDNFRRSVITEEEYTQAVGIEYARARRLVTILSAGGLGRLREEGIFKMERNLEIKRDKFISTVVDNIEKYKAEINRERELKKAIKDNLKRKGKEAQVNTVKRVVENRLKNVKNRDSALNKYLRRKSATTPQNMAISSLKQNRIRAAMRRMIETQDREEVLRDLFDELNLSEEQELEITEFFNVEYRKLISDLRNTDNTEELVHRMESDLEPETESNFNLDKTMENVEELGHDPLDQLVDDEQTVEEGHSDGAKLSNEELVKDLDNLPYIEESYNIGYLRETTSSDVCEPCSDKDGTVYDTEEEAYEGHSECYNAVYNGGTCYCRVSIVVTDKELDY